MLNAQAIKQTIHNLLLEHPELADDEVLRADMLEGATDFHEALTALVGSMRDSESMAKAITDRIKTMQERRDRVEYRVESLRKIIFQLMEAADLRKVELPEATLSFRTVPAGVVVMDEAAIPSEYFETKKVLSKTRLRAALDAGATIEGASLGNGGVALAVRTR